LEQAPWFFERRPPGNRGMHRRTHRFSRVTDSRLRKSVDTRSDLYSLGATIYHLLHGKPPFSNSQGARTLIVAHLTTKPAPLIESRFGWLVPAMVNNIVQKLLMKEPADVSIIGFFFVCTNEKNL
jgi:serine/threonine protein kinase